VLQSNSGEVGGRYAFVQVVIIRIYFWIPFLGFRAELSMNKRIERAFEVSTLISQFIGDLVWD